MTAPNSDARKLSPLEIVQKENRALRYSLGWALAQLQPPIHEHSQYGREYQAARDALAGSKVPE